MTAAVLEREIPQLAQRQAFQEALKAYFKALASLRIPPEDLEFTEHLLPELDFVVRTEPSRVSEITDRLANLAFDIRNRYGVRFSAAVLPKVDEGTA
jgi:hypothetical protein